MFTVKELINNRDEINTIAKKYGFSSLIVFKGFTKDEEHNFNVLVGGQEVQPGETTEYETVRQLHLTDELEKLTKLKVKVLAHCQMDGYFLSNLDGAGCANLLDGSFHDNLLNIFGLDWEFSDNYSTYESKLDDDEEDLSFSGSTFDDGWGTTMSSSWSSLPELNLKDAKTNSDKKSEKQEDDNNVFYKQPVGQASTVFVY